MLHVQFVDGYEIGAGSVFDGFSTADMPPMAEGVEVIEVRNDSHQPPFPSE